MSRARRFHFFPAAVLAAAVLLLYISIATLSRSNLTKLPLSLRGAWGSSEGGASLHAEGGSSPPNEGAKPRVPGARVLVGDGRVRDCISGEVRGTGVRGVVRTVPLVGQGIKEDRNASRRSFQEIFKKRFWGTDSSGLTASGYGSTLDFTVELRAALNSLVHDVKLRLGLERIRLLDVPCGDMKWMQEFLKDRDDVDYTGMDIVPELIERHRKTFTDKPWRFHSRDIIKDGLSEPYDLILCRDMLHHSATQDVITFLAQISLSGSHFLFASSHRTAATNTDVDLGALSRGRMLNPEAPPVALSAPLCFCRDGPPNEEKSLMVWELPLRQVVGCEAAQLMKITADRCSPKQSEYYACGNWSV